MANVTLNTRIITRNDLKATWLEKNPILLKGEMGVEIDTGKFKFGDGAKNWKALEYGSAKPAVVGAAAPQVSDLDYELGQIWVVKASGAGNGISYILASKTETEATWKRIVTPEDLQDLGAGDMLKAVYATNEKTAQGYVDKAILADTATKLATGIEVSITGDATGSAAGFDGSKDTSIDVTLANTGVEAGTYTKVTVDTKGRVTTGEKITLEDIPGTEEGKTLKETLAAIGTNKQDKITGAATTIVDKDLAAGKVVVSDASGKVAVSTMDTTTLEGLPGRIDTLAGSVDNIPRYNYKTGLSADVEDAKKDDQSQIDATVIPVITATYTTPEKWDAVVVGISFKPSDVKKDALYFYNGTAWTFLYYVSTGINRANADVAGIVESSDDITFTDGAGVVNQAGKVKHGLTIGSKTFDGSADVTLESADLADVIPVATAEKVGGIKASTAVNQIGVAADGIASVNSVAVAKLTLNGDTLILDGGNA